MIQSYFYFFIEVTKEESNKQLFLDIYLVLSIKCFEMVAWKLGLGEKLNLKLEDC